MNSPDPLIQPSQCVLLLVDQQAGLAFGVGSGDRQVLLSNTVALARTATVFKIPVIVMNCWEDDAVRKALSG